MAVVEQADDVTAEVAADALDPLVGMTLDGRFRIVDVIGRGAMGTVYRAVQLPLNRAVALKVLDSRYGAGREESFKQRFLVEAALTAKLSHPNTVRVLDYGSTKDGLFFLAMEYLDGESLDQVLTRGALPWRRVLSIGQQVARALREAHELGVVHRDLKPGNVVLLNADDDTDHVKVLDFGLVKSFVEGHELEGRAITQQGMLMGSPPYMAPEQGEKNRADPRSDIYSLGVVLYEALTGKVPFTGNAPLEIILKHVHQPVPPLVTPPNLEPAPASMVDVVMKCLAKSPMDRFQSMDEVLGAMTEVASPILTPAHETPSLEVMIPVVPEPGRGRLGLILGFALALVLGIGGTVIVMKSITAPTPPAPPAPVEVKKATPATDEELVVVNPPAPKPTKIVFHVETEPAGATVSIEGKALGLTPLDVERPLSGDATTAKLTLTKDGFLPLEVTAGGSGPRIEIRQVLQKAPEAPKVEKAPDVKAEPVKKPEPKRPERRRKQTSTPAPGPKPAAKLDEEDAPTPPSPLEGELKRPTVRP